MLAGVVPRGQIPKNPTVSPLFKKRMTPVLVRLLHLLAVGAAVAAAHLHHTCVHDELPEVATPPVAAPQRYEFVDVKGAR